MFTVGAFLPFLPLIVDAHIRQLGDADFAKRAAATRFLSKVLQDTDGWKNQEAMAKIKTAMESKDAEIKHRATLLYNGNRWHYFQECPAVFIILRIEPPSFERRNRPTYERMSEILIDFAWGGPSAKGRRLTTCDTKNRIYMSFIVNNFTREKFRKLMSHKEVVACFPVSSTEKIGGGHPRYFDLAQKQWEAGLRPYLSPDAAASPSIKKGPPTPPVPPKPK